MADQKITGLNALGDAPATEDLLAVVDDPSGSAETKKMTVGNLLDAVYPVGAVYISVSSTSPATLFGGTWSAFGAGKVLVGLDSGDTDFDTAEETGGSKTHTLSEAEMPAHRHQANSNNTFYDEGASNTDFALKFQTIAGYNAKTIAQAVKGSGSAHNNVQPYIVVYMWKRTA